MKPKENWKTCTDTNDNARLIAAAPELLDALICASASIAIIDTIIGKKLLNKILNGDYESFKKTLDMADKAIAKAKGQS